MMTKGELYRGFRVLDIVDVEDCAAKGLHLRHEKTGLEVFHLLNDDEENLFAFAFKTPTFNSTGVAHVLEHSVLCGSNKYPVRDAFIRLENQSVNTYLNAYTASDHTVYPASSTVRADYFNLMSVYADAVFFPLLKPEIFLQECNHLEFDSKGNPSIQGVVYNEMKGVFSSYESVVSAEIERAINSGTQYEHESGGDPLCIPSLTYREFCSYHKKYYCAANCFVFLYGNISTEEQLDFIDKNILSKLKENGKKAVYPKPNTNASIPAEVQAYAPSDEKEKKSTVSVIWKILDDKKPRKELEMELLFLNNLLCGNDGAPIPKALTASELGEDVAPQTGAELSQEFCSVSFALRGVQKKNARKVRRVIYDTLRKIADDGLEQSELDRIFMRFEIANRERCRFGGPYSLTLLRRVLRGWRYGGKPWDLILFRSETEKLKERIQGDPNYISSLIRKYFLDNDMCSLVTVTPSAKWTRERDEKERLNVEKKLRELGLEKAKAQLEKMHRAQEKELTHKEKNCIPSISRSKLDLYKDKIKTRHCLISGIDFLSNREDTNGIVYVKLAFPVDCLAPKDYPLMSSLSEWLPQMGWGNLSWDKALSFTDQITGSLVAYVRASSSVSHLSESKRRKRYVGRDYFIVEFKVIEELLDRAFDLVADCLNQTDFSDEKRLRDLVIAQYNTLSSVISPYAQHFAANRALCHVNRHYAVTELWEGLTSIRTSAMMMQMNSGLLSKKLNDLFKKIKKSGVLIHVTGNEGEISRTRKILPDFLRKIKAVPIQEKRLCGDRDFYKFVELPGTRLKAKKTPGDFMYVDEVVPIPGTVGYVYSILPSMPFGSKGCVQDMVFTHSLSNTDLWNKIRTSGGAYGVYFREVSDAEFSRFYTYRDPKPFDSLEQFYNTLQEVRDRVYDEDAVEKAIIGCYSDEVTPKTPSGRGTIGFLREICGISGLDKEKRVKWLLELKEGDLQKAAKRYAKNALIRPDWCRTVILCAEEMISAKMKQKTGIIIDLSI